MNIKVPTQDRFRHKKLILLLVWQYLLFLIFGPMLQKSMVQRTFVINIALFAIVLLVNLRDISDIMKRNKQIIMLPYVFIVFLAVSALYLFLSYQGLHDFFDLGNLPFEKEYIPRHFMVVAELLLPIGLGYLMYKSNFVYKFKNRTLLLLSVVIFSLRYMNYNPLPYAGVLVAAFSLCVFRTKRIWLLPLIILALPGHAAYNIAAVAVCFVTLFRKWIIKLFCWETNIKIVVFFIFLATIITLFAPELYDIISKDENSLWRLMVWTNELNSLYQTNGLGVGFGTAYVTPQIYFEVANANMYIDFDNGSIYERLFLVANHNSFLNMFYRMGIIGGSLFILIFIYLIKWTLGLYVKASESMKSYIWWAFCGFVYQIFIILFNPGLEMMQFAMSFCLAIGIQLAVLFKAQSEITFENE